jgi:signal transduction histidine kinase
MQARRIAPWVAASATVAGFALSLTFNSLAGTHGAEPLTTVPWVAAAAATTGVGLMLATRRAGNPIGWLLLANALVLALMAVTSTYAVYAVLERHETPAAAQWAVLWDERGWPALFFIPIAVAFVFPDGRLPSPRWRRVAAGTAVSFAILIVASLFASDRYSEQYRHVPSPLPSLPESIVSVPFMVSGLGALAGLFAGALAIRARMRRSTGVERLQMRWLAYAAALIPGAVVLCILESRIAGEAGIVTDLSVGGALFAIPTAVGIAVMRYRLYEIDRLINRTLVYAVLSVGLGAIFAAVSLLLGVAIGAGSTVPTAAATLAVALLFGPLRSRAQVLVDRRFARARYEGLRTIERFLGDLRAGRAAPEATSQVIAEAMGDPGLELFFWLPDEELYVDASGRAVEQPDAPGSAWTPVRRGTLLLGAVRHDRSLGEHPDLLDSVIGAAGLAIEIGRLRVEVRRRLAEVEESRARIVTAGYEERRRLERDLHDGAQQRLVSIGLGLRHIQGQLPSAQADQLNAAVDEVADAIEELRELARGVRPAGLDDGLSPAMRELASRSPLRTRVEATDERFDDRLETAAYFVASEALANAAKHARASEVIVSAARSNGHLVVSIHDDGVGGAVACEGSGLAGMTDRVAALGGSLTVESPPGRGTVVRAELPCAS